MKRIKHNGFLIGIIFKISLKIPRIFKLLLKEQKENLLFWPLI